MDDFQLLEDYFNHMVGKTIIGSGIINDKFAFKLNDGSVVILFSENDLSLNVIYTN